MSASEWDQAIPSGGYGPEKPYELDVYTTKFDLDPTDEFNPNKVKIFFTGKTNDPDWPEFTLALRLDDGWKVIGDGDEIVHENTQKKLPTARSQFGRFLSQIIPNPVNDELADLKKELMSRGLSPRHAKSYDGIRFVIGEQKDTMTDKETKEKREFSWAVPVGYNGVVAGTDIQAAQEQQQQQSAALLDNLKQLAKDSNDHSEFANRALSEYDLSADPDLSTSVMDPSDKGFYKQHHG